MLILRAFGGPRYDATLMRDFVLSRDVIYAVALYGAILAGVLAWLFLSKQKILARNGFNAICIAVRLGLLFAVLLWFCWFVGIHGPTCLRRRQFRVSVYRPTVCPGVSRAT